MSGEISRFYTTDDFTISKQSLKILSNRRDLFWNYDETEDDAFDIGAEANHYSGEYIGEGYDSVSGQLILGHLWNLKNYSWLKVGGHELEYQDKTFTILNYELGHSVQFEKAKTTIKLSKDFQFIQQQIPLTLEEGLVRDELSLYWEYSFNDHLRSPLNFSKISISDGNNADQYDLSLYYGDAYPIWWWIGYGVSGLSYSDRKEGYWSPEKFWAHGPRFEISYPFTDWWQVTAGFNYNFIKEDDFDQGTSTYSTLGLQYGQRDEGLISLSWIDIRSEQQSNEWISRGYLLQFEKSL